MWKITPNPTYSPNLATSDFFLIPKLKESLKEIHFKLLKEFKKIISKWIKITSNTFYEAELKELLPR